MIIELGPSGLLAKVTAISDDGRSVYFDLRNGKTGSLDNVDQEYSVGDVLLITGDIDNNRVEIKKVPSSAWPDELWVGIVKIKLPDITIIDSGGRFRTVPDGDHAVLREREYSSGRRGTGSHAGSFEDADQVHSLSRGG